MCADRPWDVLLIGGASGVGKTRVSYRLAQHFGVGITEIDDFQVILERMTTPEQQPVLHVWRTDPASFMRLNEQEKLAFAVRYATVMAEPLEYVIANHLEGGPPIVLEGDFLLPSLAAQSTFDGIPAAGRVRSLFVYEEDEAQIARNIAAREGASQPERARASWCYSEWLRQEAGRLGLPALAARPWETVFERALDLLASPSTRIFKPARNRDHAEATMSATSNLPVNVAVVQDSSVFLDRDASMQKMIALASEAAGNGAQLVLFPEAFIPGYPRGFSFGATVGNRGAEGRALYRRYAEAAITGPGPDTILLAETARDLGIYLAVGIVEKDAATPGTLYCSLALFDPDGMILNLHRKIKPTASERLIWGEGDGSSLVAMPTDIGKIGGLICWENLMPLARTSLYQQGIELYLAPTADSRETWQSTIRHIAMEGRCFVLSANQYVTKADYPDDLGTEATRELAQAPDPLCRGGSAIVGPLGEYLAGPLWDEAGILYATLDPGLLTEARFDFDVVGHYSRPDLFQLSRSPITAMPPLDNAGIDAMLGDLLFGGAPGLFPPPLHDDDLDDLPDDLDSFFPSFPATWTEKKPATKLPAKPSKRRRRPKS